MPNNREAKLNRTLTTSSWRSLDEADHGTCSLTISWIPPHGPWIDISNCIVLVLVVVDGYAATKGADKETYEQILDRLKERRIPTTLIMNKASRQHKAS